MEKIKIIEDFFKRLNVAIDSIDKKDSGIKGLDRYVINTTESDILIGNKGETLNAISHILKKILEKTLGEYSGQGFFIDIGDYQNKKVQEIKNKAVIFGERARFFKKDIEMPPMSAYERMIVHSTFTDCLDITTE